MKDEIEKIILDGDDDTLTPHGKKLVNDLFLLFEKYAEEERKLVRIELYQLDWIKILDIAIKSRPTSWGKDIVREWRNASDEILGAMMTEAEKQKIFINPFQKLVENKGEE